MQLRDFFEVVGADGSWSGLMPMKPANEFLVRVKPAANMTPKAREVGQKIYVPFGYVEFAGGERDKYTARAYWLNEGIVIVFTFLRRITGALSSARFYQSPISRYFRSAHVSFFAVVDGKAYEVSAKNPHVRRALEDRAILNLLART